MEFIITRIKTSIGIFRLEGNISASGLLCFSTAEFMGTDGWVEIDLESESGTSILSKIEGEVASHLRG
ncbi:MULTISPECIES: hypothetical protein [Pseudoalteromonas]|uniref:Uncharacterized protein n=1 Tax=Pseudoalteromonas obscura TaxID=3048491 RepID=A0ABT7EGB6_9GAMM|nr:MULTISPECIES: hypothetical protein [Pseudoalteromonas]MBQ4835711.1 hypothetical protein [Pseudoalteromonas luteoviolacea]MDK2594036.1 hypothetical protein [Pseudoalteromonas sp. P94(2023)]